MRLVIAAAATALLVAAGCGSTSSTSAHAGASWSYAGPDGPDHWASLDPGYAACDGVQQSPIDLRNPTRATLSDLVFEYRPMRVQVEDNGHTVKVTGARSCNVRIGEGVFPLLQFHFHTPSEHAVDGRRSAAEVHFVHDAGDGRHVVVGILVESGAPDGPGGVCAVTDLLPLEVGQSGSIEFDPRTLLPADRRVFHYHGSLTTPPCSETVSWFVLAEPIRANESCLVALRAQEGMNARPLQPVGEREILTNR